MIRLHPLAWDARHMLAVRAVLRFALVAAVVLGAAMLLWSATMPARAAAPAGSDPNGPIARWIHTLTSPDGYLCCGEGDCRRTTIQFDADGRWAWIGKDQFGESAPDQWMPISERVWNETHADGDPPDGRAYVCFWGGEVKCARSAGGA